MKLHEAIEEVVESNMFNSKIRRESWTHGDSLVIKNDGGYMGGELYWVYGGGMAKLFFVDDLTGNDWCVE